MRKQYSTIVFLLIAFFLFSVVSVSAQNVNQESVKIVSNQPITITQVCSNSTYSNITTGFIDALNTQLINTSTSMPQITSNTYSYVFTNTSQSGTYYFYGICDENGVQTTWGLSYLVSPSGRTFNGGDISIYIFFLLICLTLVYFSGKLIKYNGISKDPITNSELYKLKKKNELLYYIKVLKTKLYIVGLFGIYLSVILFTALLNNLVYNLGLVELNTILSNLNIVLLWGLVPFIIGWIVYIIIVFYRTTVDVMKYQFGSITDSQRYNR
jgi:hypothetical protein